MARRLSAGWSPGATTRAGPPASARSRAASSVEQGEAGRARSPTCARSSRPGLRRQPVEHVCDLRHQRDRRRLEIVAPFPPVAERPAVDTVPAREHLGRRKRHARIDQQHRRPGKSARSTGASSSPAPSPRIGRLSRQAGTSLPSPARPRSHAPGRSPHSDVSSRSAAAASAEPPPIPAATGSLLSRRIAAPSAAPARLCQRPRRLESPDCPRIERVGERPADGQRRARPPARRSAGRRRCRRRRSSRCRGGRRRAARGREAPG